MVPIAHASDLGGSTRGPASWCGAVGLHPSRGRVSAGPIRDENRFGMSQCSVITRTMRDTATMLDGISRPCSGDPFVVRRPNSRYLDFLVGPGKRLKIGWSNAPLMDASVDPEIAHVVKLVAYKLQDIGHDVEESSPKFDLSNMDEMLTDIWYFRFDKYLDDLGARNSRKVSSNTVEAATLRFYEYSKKRSVDSYLKAIEELNVYRRGIGAWFDNYDIWLSPTCAQVAKPNGVFGMNVDISPEEFLRHEQAPCQFMVWANVCGAPAISLPLGMHSSGLPIGIQLSAKPGFEELLIGLGAELERVMPWRGRTPPLHVSSLCK